MFNRLIVELFNRQFHNFTIPRFHAWPLSFFTGRYRGTCASPVGIEAHLRVPRRRPSLPLDATKLQHAHCASRMSWPLFSSFFLEKESHRMEKGKKIIPSRKIFFLLAKIRLGAGGQGQATDILMSDGRERKT